jgi:hypothetical protein
MTDTNVFQLCQPGTFIDPLTEVLRNGARVRGPSSPALPRILDKTRNFLHRLPQPALGRGHVQLAANARVAGDAMRDGFKLFVQLFSAIVGASIALRFTTGSIDSKLLGPISKSPAAVDPL